MCAAKFTLAISAFCFFNQLKLVTMQNVKCFILNFARSWSHTIWGRMVIMCTQESEFIAKKK